MQQLFGDFLAVPESNLQILQGGETVKLGSKELLVLYTPGHASHHVTYFDPSERVAYVGDTAGISIEGHPFILPATPPPDISLELWTGSLESIAQLRPRRLFLTHLVIRISRSGTLKPIGNGCSIGAHFRRRYSPADRNRAKPCARLDGRWPRRRRNFFHQRSFRIMFSTGRCNFRGWDWSVITASARKPRAGMQRVNFRWWEDAGRIRGGRPAMLFFTALSSMTKEMLLSLEPCAMAIMLTFSLPMA